MRIVPLIAAVAVIALFAIMYGSRTKVTVQHSPVSDLSIDSKEFRPTGRSLDKLSRSSRVPQSIGAPFDTRAERISSLINGIKDAIRSGNEQEQQEVFTKLLPALVSLDPAAAADLLKKVEQGPFREEYLLRLGQLWAAQNSEDALQWATELNEESERLSTINSICLEIGQSDPQLAIQTVESLDMPEDKSTLQNLVQLWAARDVSAASSWALQKPAGESRDTLLARVAFVMAETDPSEAASFVVKTITPGDAQTEAAISVLHKWALQDFDAANRWVGLFPEGQLRDRAQTELEGIKRYNESLDPTTPLK